MARFNWIINIYTQQKETYSTLIVTKGVEWFASFVYSLRNALFHEIISPLDEDWQVIFKSAYLVLKEVTDICIDMIKCINGLSTVANNPIIEYFENHEIKCINDLADYVEILGITAISITKQTIIDGLINVEGTINVKLKLQEGEDFANDNGVILPEEQKTLRLTATLSNDFKIAKSKETGQSLITFEL